jgi:hypothetical protein
MPATFTVARMTNLKAPGRPGFDAAVRVARRALAERIAAKTQQEHASTGAIDAPLPLQNPKLQTIPIK